MNKNEARSEVTTFSSRDDGDGRRALGETGGWKREWRLGVESVKRDWG